MNIPDKIKIGPFNYDVTIVEEVQKGKEYYGLVEFMKLTIKIQEDIARQQQEQTLLHEVVHAILYQMGRTELNNDEVFVDTFADYLYGFIQDNKLQGEG